MKKPLSILLKITESTLFFFLRLKIDNEFTMPFTEEDKIIIKHYRMDKGYGARRLLTEFPDRGWTRGGLNTSRP